MDHNVKRALEQLGMSRPPRHIAISSHGYAVVFPPTNQKLNREMMKSFPSSQYTEGYITDTNTKFWWLVPEEAGIETKLQAFAEVNDFQFTDAAREHIERRLASLEADRLYAEAVEPTGEINVPGLLAELRPYQLAGLEYAQSRDRVYFADEMGLGKTAQAICWVRMKDAYPCLVVPPANARTNWVMEHQKWLGDAVRTRVLTSTPKEETGLADWVKGPGRRVVIVSYNGVDGWLPHLRYLPWRALILDEAHYVRKYTARRTRNIAGIVRENPIRLRGLISGTPVERGTPDLRPQLEILGVEDLFRGYVSLDGKGTPADDLAVNRRLAETVMVRRKKAQVEAQLPVIDEQWMAVDLDEAALALYRRKEDELVARARGGAQASALEVPMGTLRRLIGEAKVRNIVEWFEPMWTTEAVPLVFCYHHSVMDTLQNAFEGSGLHVVRYDGKMTKSAKDRAIERFQAGNGRVLIAQIGAAGVALNLQRADTVVFTELDWLPTTHAQALARANRIGSKHSHTYVRYLWTPETLDEDIRSVLTQRAAQIGIVVDGDIGPAATLQRLMARRDAT